VTIRNAERERALSDRTPLDTCTNLKTIYVIKRQTLEKRILFLFSCSAQRVVGADASDRRRPLALGEKKVGLVLPPLFPPPHFKKKKVFFSTF
jgi:hypothetical protein